MFYSSVAWAGNLALLLVILVRAARGTMLRRYPVFYSYIAFTLMTSAGIVPVTMLFGYASRQYYYVYNIVGVCVPLLQLWVLRDLYGRIVGNDKTAWRRLPRLLILLAAVTSPIAVEVFSLRRADFFKSYHLWTLSLQAAACVAVYRALGARRELNPGRNVKGILAGLSVMVAFQAINFGRFIFREETFQIFAFFVPFIYSIALMAFSYTLWNYEPIVVAAMPEEGLEERLQRINGQLKRTVRSLVLPQ